MRFNSALAAVVAVGAVVVVTAWMPAKAMGPVGPSVTSKADTSLVEEVHYRRRGDYGYYPHYRAYPPWYHRAFSYNPYYYNPYRPFYGCGPRR